MSIIRTLSQLRVSVQSRWQLDNSPDMGDVTNSLGINALNEMINDGLSETHDILVGKWADYKTVGPIQFPTIASQDTYAFDTIVSTGPAGIPPFYKLRKLEIQDGSRWRRLLPADLEASHYYQTSGGTVSNRFRYRMQLDNTGLMALVLMPPPGGVQTLRMWYVATAPQLTGDGSTYTFAVPIELKLLLAVVGRDVLDRQDLDNSAAVARIAQLSKQLDVAADGLDVSEPFMLSPLGAGHRYGDDSGWNWDDD